MAIATTTVLIAAAAAAAIAGAGVSAYGSYQQGKTQDAVAQFNAKQQEQQARQQTMALQTQAAMQKNDAEANFRLREAEAKARMNNAKAMEQNALAQDAVNRENSRKRRTAFERQTSEVRSAIAASGVVESSGTPLDMLAETAALIQQDQEEQHYVGEVQRRTIFAEAAFERLGGKLALQGATLNRDSAVAEAGLRNVAAKGEYLAGMREAEITRLTGKAARAGANYQAGATILSGVSSAADMGVRYKRS